MILTRRPLHLETHGHFVLIVNLINSDALVCRDETMADYQRRFRETHAELIWEHPAVKSYYQNADGKVTLLWPWKIIDMWRWTKQANPADYDFN